GYIKTSGANTNPTNDDERIGLLYQFFDASHALITEAFLPADQSVADMDWHEVNGSVYIPPGSIPDSMVCIAQFGKDATGTAWFDIMDLISDFWTAMIFGDEAETPQGWMYWTSPSLIGTAKYDDSEAHSGTYSAKLQENDSEDDEIVFYSIPAPVVPEHYYHISAWIKTQGVNTNPGFTPTGVVTDRLDERMGICFFFHEPPIETSWVLVPPYDLFFYLDQTVSSHNWRKYEAIQQAPAGAAGVSMRARFTSFPTGTAWFDDFSIREVLNDSIIVIFPNGGETLPIGYEYNIAWTSTQSITDVKIEYSVDGGNNWSTIEASIPNDGSYTWTIPNTPSNDCLVRISDAVDDDPSDISNGSFIIQNAQELSGYDIYVISPTGGALTRVTDLPDKDTYNPCWSPDGTKIGHDACSYNGGFLVSHDIYITDIATGISSPLVGAEGGNDCSWSPDGSQIAFDLIIGGSGIWIVPTGGGIAKLLVEDAWHPSWSPDGSMIAFSSGSSHPIPASGDIWTIPSSGGTPTQVTFDPAVDITPAWSPDGDWIAFSSDHGGNFDIWKIQVGPDGSPIGLPMQITTNGGSDPSWSPNSQEIAFDLNNDIWKINASGGIAQQVTTSPHGDYNPSWSPDGQLIAFAGTPP
ncbi:MAG: PD40 domain-containing protein, partial [bacterium]